MVKFTEEQMKLFLSKRYYKLAKWPSRYLDEQEDEQTEEILVAFKESEGTIITSLYWRHDIVERFGLENVFYKELQKALLRL